MGQGVEMVDKLQSRAESLRTLKETSHLKARRPASFSLSLPEAL